MKLFIIFAFSIILFSCSKAPYPAPQCRSTSSAPLSLADTSAKAACIVRMNDKLLVVERSSTLYDLAYSNKHSNMSKKISDGDNADAPVTDLQCSAHQAMWEQSGINVRVGDLLTKHKNTYLFACDLQAGFDGTEDYIPAPPWQPDTVKRLVYVDLFAIEQDQWQNPDNFTSARDAFIKAPKLSEIDPINTSD